MDRVRTYFDQVAEEWDEMRAGYFNEAVREAAVAKAYPRPEMTVADVGCGTGFMTEALAPLVARVHALDRSPEMLRVAQRKLAQSDNVEYHLVEGQALPLREASLDALIAAVRALGRIGDASGVAAVEKMLARDDLPTERQLQVSVAAAGAVTLDCRWQIELAAAEALARMGKLVPEIPERHRSDERAYVRKYAEKVANEIEERSTG